MAPFILSLVCSPWTKRLTALIAIPLIIGISIPIALADESVSEIEASELNLKTDRVIVFKDGYCLVVKHGEATTNADGVVFTDDVPDAAVLGSFWAVPENGTLKSLVAGWVESESVNIRDITCTNIIEIVKSNLGKTCSFEIGEKRIDGKLLKILSNDALPIEPSVSPGDRAQRMALSSSLAAGLPGPHAPLTSLSSVTGTYFLVRTQTGDKMIQADTVKNLTIENMNSSIQQTVTKKTHHKRLSMNFGEANQQVKINLMYFRPDVRWIPTYRINLTGKSLAVKGKADQKIAEVIMQGELLNEAEDFTNVPFHVVVGVPNFRFRSVPSPIVLEASMQNVLGQAAPDIMGQGSNGFSNAIYTQRASEFSSNRAMGDDSRTAVDLPDELVGKGGNDLFVYELPPMTLRCGERAMVPILRTEAAYRDIYTWDIELTHSEDYAATSADSPSPLVLSENKVWRQVELINNTNIPWTTGAAMLVDGTQPLAQELLTYTSPGGICRVPVTVSVDLRGKLKDTEVKREYNVLEWRGSHFARVDGEIEVELANNKTEPVPVEVQLRLGGKATHSSADGKISLESFRIVDWKDQRGNPINNSSVIRWTTTIQPGECFKPTVNYEFFLQH